MPTTLRRLKLEALESCEFRGHRMGRFRRIEFWSSKTHAIAKCLDCPAQVMVITNPMPNEIDIFGDAVALNCPVTGND